jgi:hypothetical protein
MGLDAIKYLALETYCQKNKHKVKSNSRVSHNFFVGGVDKKTKGWKL